MSKLPNAPLVEVIFRLQWHLKEEELEKYSFLSGDFYQEIKNKYPLRKSLIPDGIPLPLYLSKPSHKFTRKEVKYPAIQIGPGVLTVNTTDEYYFWDDFSSHIRESISGLSEIIKDFSEYDHVHLFLNYIDFIPFDFEEQNIYEYLKDNLHIEISQSFHDSSKPSDINFMFEFENDIGWLNVQIAKGKIEENDSEGIIIDTTVVSKIITSDIDEIITWTNKAHIICSNTFKKMTKGDLYNSFQ